MGSRTQIGGRSFLQRHRDARFKLFQGLVEDTYEALLSVPLASAGDLVGVINVHHREPHEHTHDEIGTLVFIGEQLGVAIAKSFLQEENARLLEQTLEMRRELETRKLVETRQGHSPAQAPAHRRGSLPAVARAEPPSAPPYEGTGRGHHPQ